MVIGLASDHAGFEMKEFIAGFLLSQGYAIKDYGCSSTESVDYPDYAHALGYGMEKGECQLGFAFCGSANGISMTLDANVCSMPARFIKNEEAAAIAEAFLAASFEGGRHEKRVAKIPLG